MHQCALTCFELKSVTCAIEIDGFCVVFVKLKASEKMSHNKRPAAQSAKDKASGINKRYAASHLPVKAWENLHPTGPTGTSSIIAPTLKLLSIPSLK